MFGDADHDKTQDFTDDPRIVFAEFLIDPYNKPIDVGPAWRRPMPPMPTSVGLILLWVCSVIVLVAWLGVVVVVMVVTVKEVKEVKKKKVRNSGQSSVVEQV